jgi:hypothetical protein
MCAFSSKRDCIYFVSLSSILLFWFLFIVMNDASNWSNYKHMNEQLMQSLWDGGTFIQ